MIQDCFTGYDAWIKWYENRQKPTQRFVLMRIVKVHLVSATILLQSLATIFSKKAALTSTGQGIEGILINIWTGAELVALILQAMLWSHVLNKYSLNRVYPYMSLVFGVNLAAAWFFFEEVVAPHHIIGTAVVIVGIIFINAGGRFCPKPNKG